MRQVVDWVATSGRDKDKTFRLTELSAAQIEWWAYRFFLALAKAGVEVPEDIKSLGMQGVAALGIRAIAQLDPMNAKPLLDEMMTCVKVVPDREKNSEFSRPLNENDVEEVATLVELRLEVFTLHTNFSLPDWLSKLMSAETQPGSQTTGTSPEPSERSSRPERRPSRSYRRSTG